MDAPFMLLPHETVVAMISDARIVNMSAVCAWMWLIYDALLTLPDEIDRLWLAERSIVRSLYLALRYHTIVWFAVVIPVQTDLGSRLSLRSCQAYFWYYGVGGPLLTMVLGDALFVVRLNSLYGHKRHINIFTWSVYAIQTTVSTVIYIFVILTIKPLPPIPSLNYPGCLALPQESIKLTLCIWIVSLAGVSIFFFMSLYNFFSVAAALYPGRERRLTKPRMLEMQRLMPIFFLFVRDNAFYFLVIFSVHLMNLIFLVFSDNRVGLQNVGISWIVATYAVVSLRVVLNLGTQVNGREQDEELELDTVLDFHFSESGGSPLDLSTATIPNTDYTKEGGSSPVYYIDNKH